MPRPRKNAPKPNTQELSLVPVEDQPYPLPEGWKWVRGHALFKPQVSLRPSGTTFKYIDIDAVNNKNQTIQSAKILPTSEAPSRANRGVHEGDTLFSMVRPYLRNIAYVDASLSDAIASTGFYICSPLDGCNSRYIFHMMTSCYVVDGLNKFMKGDNSPSVRKGDIENFPFPLPPLDVQERIVTRIESLFAKLDEAKEKAEAVLDSFETRKAASLHKAFTGELIGKKDVKKTSLESILDTIRIGPFGSSLHEEDYITGGIPVINPKHITKQKIYPQSKVSISSQKAEELTSYRLAENDIILGRRGEMGRCAPVAAQESGWICGTGSMILRPKSGFNAEFYSHIISSQASVQYLETNAVGTTLKNLNEKIVRKLPIPKFTQDEQNTLTRILDSLLEKEQQSKEAVETVLEQIDLMKKAILAKAFRGELGN